ncbi:BspA family leucine-rich repeat surface protein [Nonlabens sp.]|uniref:BspA family leucine-rich repeat surface protein n=1 Tax=Nonlabens sp. TaxID=1888209 RepID=UPI003F6A3E97
MRLFTFIAVLFFGFIASAQTVDDFVFEVDLTNSPSTTYSFEITTGNTVIVDWGDGTNDSYTNVTSQIISHSYTTQMTYTVFVNDQLDSFKFSSDTPLTITQWGTTSWQTMFEAFKGCTDLTFSSTTLPDLSLVTDMSYMFAETGNFNQSISSWNVSNVVNMSHLFFEAYSFNQRLGFWDVSDVSDMSSMFKDASRFDQSLSTWNVSNVSNMSNMFEGAGYFNQDLQTWDVSNVSDMSSMFERARKFNQPINNWNVSNVTNMSGMFNGANDFNQPIDNWNVANVTNMEFMFNSINTFNQPLNNWDVSNVTNMNRMFAFTTSYNQPLNSWNVSNVSNMDSMFWGAVAFNQPLNSWNVSNVTRMFNMFSEATSFNQPIDNWDVSNVTSMNYMFDGATSFNQPLGGWDISNVTFMSLMFNEASSFNQDLSSWNFNSNVLLEIYVRNSGLDVDNYDALLRRFVQLNLLFNANARNGVFNPNGLKYCDNFSRDILVQNGWPISGDSQSNTCPANTFSGSVYYDFDLNGCDPSDLEAQNVAVNIVNSTNDITVYTYNGQYSANLPDGTYTVTASTNNNLFSGIPLNANVTISNNSVVTQDFCLTATTPVDDLEISILPLEDARPGFDTNYKLIYKNKGNTRLSGSVNFTYEDDFMNFLNSNPATTSSSVGMLSWDFVYLDPFETREIEFTMNLNTPTDSTFPLNSNDLLDFSTTINPTANDDTPLDNVFDLQQTVVNSYDPNDKTCLQGETILPTMVGEYVHYRIRFENEGTASAITVRIVDYIDTSKFDITTLTPLSASHDYTTTITEGNKVEFIFDNIMLPFTAPASQGYVLFKIKTVDTLVLDDTFSNQAEIYFDFNFPIITNLETTAVAVPLSINQNDLFQVSLFPNPAQSTISLSSNLEFNQYTIYDTLGAIVLQQKVDSPTLSQDILVDHLVSGLYFVEVKSDQMSSVLKLIKE